MMNIDPAGSQKPYIYGGETGLSYDDLKRRQMFAEALMQRGASSQPKTAMEGINSATQTVMGALLARKLGEREQERVGKSTAFAESIFGGGFGAQPSMSTMGGAPQGGPAGRGPSPYSIPPGTLGNVALGFDESLAKTESGGDYHVVNKEGYVGKYQFGKDRLADFNRATSNNVTMEQFRFSPQIQEGVQDWHVQDIDAHIRSNGLDRYIGQTIGGVPITWDGMRAMAHLGGKGGMEKFVTSGGKYNPADSNGTSLADYARTHAGGGTISTSNGQSGMGGVDPRIMQAMADPFTPPEYKSALQMLMVQQMQANQPMSEAERLDLEYKRAQIAKMQQPEAPSLPTDVQEYEYARRQGFKGTLADWQQLSRAETNVNVDMNGNPVPQLLGTQGLVAIPAPGTPQAWRVEAAPGSPLALEQQQQVEGEQNKDRQQNLKLGGTLENINLNIREVEDGGLPVTGGIGELRRSRFGQLVSGSDAVDFGNRTAAITDSAALAEVQNMRDNSKTGGAVGQLTDSERTAIGNSVTAMNSATSAEEYVRAAKAYRKLALDLAYGEGTWSFDEETGEVSLQPASPLAVAPGAAAPGAAAVQPFPGGMDRLSQMSRNPAVAPAPSARGTVPSASTPAASQNGSAPQSFVANEQVRASAEAAGMTPEELWQFFPNKERFQ